jgi:hypothetical protein
MLYVRQAKVVLLDVYPGATVAVDVRRQLSTKPLIMSYVQVAPPNVVIMDPLPSLAVNIGLVSTIVGNLCCSV